jgi:ribosome biogenesis GTPase
VEISYLLPRRTAITRKAPKKGAVDQVLAANVDLALITMAVDADFNIRRVERLLAIVYQSGATPNIVLTKADLGRARERVNQLMQVAAGVPVVVTSALTNEGIVQLSQLLPGKTAVLLGSSGVGKSTLVNQLDGSHLARTRAVHHTGQGRHTTSHRQLTLLDTGGVIIDTPGLREMQLWVGSDATDEVFADIDSLAATCHFSDCRHEQEPGCAVTEAIGHGTLDKARLRSYHKLQRELQAIEARVDIRVQLEQRRKFRAIHRLARQQMAAKGRWD